MADINLLQNQLKDTTMVAVQRTKLAIWVLLAVLIVLGGISGALYFVTQSTQKKLTAVVSANNDLQKKIDTQESGLSSAKAFQAQLANVTLLLKNHLLVTPVIDELGKYTYLKAQYLNFDVDQQTGRMHLEGVVDSYTGLGKLLLGLSGSQQFKNVKLLGVSPSDTSANGFHFSIDLVANEKLFISTDPVK